MAALAKRLWRDYRAREPGTCFANPAFALDLQQAYRLQAAVSELRVAAGDRVIGYKVGCTGPGTITQFGMAGPIRGCLYASEVRRDGASLDAAEFAHLAVEGEMAIRIGEDGGIAAAFPVIELHNFVFRAPQRTLVELVANNGLNAGVVLPAERWLSSRTGLTALTTMTVQINERRFGPSDLWPLPAGPDASADWLRRHLAVSGLELRPGQIVLVGTPLGLYPVVPGDRIAVLIDDEPAATCAIT